MSAPHPSLRTLDPLVGTWAVSGPGLSGQVRYEWLEGGHYLVQHVDMEHNGERTRGVEYIGYDEASGDLHSHYFATGPILEYVYELSGDTLTIWYGGKDSPAKFSGRFSPDGRTNVGAWEWPGGGYESTITRID